MNPEFLNQGSTGEGAVDRRENISPEAPRGGQYPVIKALGAGHQAETVLCQDPLQKGRQLVQKLVNPGLSSRYPDLVEVIFSELSRVAHPSLALVRDFGWEGSRAFLVRDYVEGETFLQGLKNAGTEEITLRIYQILEVLDYLYSQNIFHLNLKSENIFLTAGGGVTRPVVTDFGLGAVFHAGSGGEGKGIGYPPYTAPEYAQDPHPSPRADLYSVGVLCYAALSRRLPFGGGNPEAVFQNQLKTDPPPLKKIAKISSSLSDFVQRLLSRDPEKRFSHPREALLNLEVAAGGILPSQKLVVPPIFSHPEEIFRHKYMVKMFRRIFLQGRGWAFEGKRGSGKTFFARWLQRYFLRNRRPVRFYHGEEIFQCAGDSFLNPAEPLYVIIDDADFGPVQAWLDSRPYSNVIAFGEDMSRYREDPRWQVFSWEDLELSALQNAMESVLGSLEENVFQELAKRNRGNPGAMVQQCRAISRLGILQKTSGGWRLQGDKFIRALHSSLGPSLGNAIPSLEEKFRGVVTLLAVARVPLSVDDLGEWCKLDPKELHAYLVSMVFEEVLERKVCLGREYFLAKIPSPERIETSISHEEIRSWVEALNREGWYEAALRVLEQFYSSEELQKDPGLLLKRCRILSDSGHYAEVFKWITSSFVKGLPADLQGEAFEILAQSLIASEKAPQAEAAWKNAFQQYRGSKNLAGQARVLRDLGTIAMRMGDQSRALKFFDQALSMAEEIPEDDPLLGSIELRIGDLYARATDYSNAESRYRSSMDHLRRPGKAGVLAETYLHYGVMLGEQGDILQMESYVWEALTLASFKMNRKIQGEAFLALADLEEFREDQGAILERLKEAVFAFSRTPYQRLQAEALVRLAYFLEANRQLEVAESHAQTVLELASSFKDAQLLGQAHLILGKVRRRDVERLEEAQKQFELSREALEKTKNPKWLWECEFEQGEIERTRNHASQARSHYEKSLKMIEGYLGQVSSVQREQFLKEGKRDQVEMALKWLR